MFNIISLFSLIFQLHLYTKKAFKPQKIFHERVNWSRLCWIWHLRCFHEVLSGWSFFNLLVFVAVAELHETSRSAVFMLWGQPGQLSMLLVNPGSYFSLLISTQAVQQVLGRWSPFTVEIQTNILTENFGVKPVTFGLSGHFLTWLLKPTSIPRILVRVHMCSHAGVFAPVEPASARNQILALVWLLRVDAWQIYHFCAFQLHIIMSAEWHSQSPQSQRSQPRPLWFDGRSKSQSFLKHHKQDFKKKLTLKRFYLHLFIYFYQSMKNVELVMSV